MSAATGLLLHKPPPPSASSSAAELQDQDQCGAAAPAVACGGAVEATAGMIGSSRSQSEEMSNYCIF